MWYLLSPRMWIATAIFTALIVTHFVSFRLGKGVVRAQWNKEKVVQLEAARKQEEAFRATEQRLVAAKQESEARYVALKNRYSRDAADAQSELGRLRDELAARNSATPEDPAALARAVGGAGLERELLGHCATALVGLASEADRLEAQVVGLQGYVKNVCLKATP